MKRPIKLYLAILNKGWIRREIVYKVLPDMVHTEGVELIFEEPSISWHNPICSNRNRIVKRFLKTDCDFLLMMDDDIVPQHNPAQLVFADKDIIGSPAKIRQDGGFNWVAYVYNKVVKGYVPVDFSEMDARFDLYPVDIVGTGCIMIKRRVLEKLKAPFLIKFNRDGICEMGTDFAFCEKAKKAGFEIYTTGLDRVCEHWKQFGLLDITGYDDSDYRDPIAGKYKIPWGGFAINQKDWHFIKRIIEENNVKNILEFGSGLSSLLMSEKAKVISYETDKKHMEEILAKSQNGNLTIELWDGKEIKGRIKKYDLAFIDGPLGKANGGIGRQHSIRIASERSDRVIIHDAGRDDERYWQKAYLRENFILKARNGNHLQRCHYWERR